MAQDLRYLEDICADSELCVFIKKHVPGITNRAILFMLSNLQPYQRYELGSYYPQDKELLSMGRLAQAIEKANTRPPFVNKEALAKGGIQFCMREHHSGVTENGPVIYVTILVDTDAYYEAQTQFVKKEDWITLMSHDDLPDNLGIGTLSFGRDKQRAKLFKILDEEGGFPAHLGVLRAIPQRNRARKPYYKMLEAEGTNEDCVCGLVEFSLDEEEEEEQYEESYVEGEYDEVEA